MKVEYIAVHCSASLPNPRFDVRTIDKWHKERGFDKVGYHFVLPTNGTIQVGRMEHENGAHVLGYNAKALGICLIGGVDTEGNATPNYTKDQWLALATLVRGLLIRYPRAKLQGHRDFPAVKKDCPCFDVSDWWKGINP